MNEVEKEPRPHFESEAPGGIRRAARPGRRAATPMPFASFRDEWLAFYSPAYMSRATIAKDRQLLRELGEAIGPGAKAEDLTPALIASWVGSLVGRQLRLASIKTMVDRVRCICQYAVHQGYIDANPVDARKRWLPNNYEGRAAPPGPAPLTEQGAQRLLSHLLRRRHTWEGHRLFAVVATGLYTGFRKSRLLGWEAECVDQAAGTFRETPGRGPRPMSAKLAEVLGDWLPTSGSPWVFPGVKRRGPWTGGPYGDRPQDQLKAAGDAVGVAGLTFEVLRAYWDWSWGAVGLGEGTHPEEPRPGPAPEPVAFDPGGKPVVLGNPKPALSSAGRKVVGALLDAGDEGLGKAQLLMISGDAIGIIRRLAGSDDGWEKVIHLPGKPGMRYRIGPTRRKDQQR